MKNRKPLKYLKANQYIIENPELKNMKENLYDPVIIAESDDVIKTVSVSEAIMLMNLKDQNAIFFKNVQSKRLNILYRRPDGNIGWVDQKKMKLVEFIALDSILVDVDVDSKNLFKFVSNFFAKMI